MRLSYTQIHFRELFIFHEQSYISTKEVGLLYRRKAGLLELMMTFIYVFHKKYIVFR